MTLRIIFMGTPDFSVPTLKALAEAGHEILAVYTQPPRPAGRRGLELKPSPVQREAERLGIAVRCPVSLKTSAEQNAFAALGADVAVVRARSWRRRSWAALTAMPRCCRAGGVRRPSTAPSWRATRRPA